MPQPIPCIPSIPSMRRRGMGMYGAGAPPAPSILESATAYWKAKGYSGSGSLLDGTGNGHDAQLGSGAGADSNDPLFLEYDAADGAYLYLPGIAGNVPYIADHANRPTADIDIQCKVALDDWTPATKIVLAAKDDTTVSRVWIFSIGTTGLLKLEWFEPGTKSAESSAPVGATDGDIKWVRVTLDADVGGLNHTVSFYTSDDGVNWTALGGPVLGAGTTSLAGSGGATAQVSLGGYSDGGANGQLITGKYYRCRIYSDLAESPLALAWDVDFADSAEPHTSFTEASSNGATVTINRSASGRKAALVDRSLLLFGTDDYLTIPDHADLDFAAGVDFTVVVAMRQYAAFSAGARYIDKRDGDFAGGWFVSNGSPTATEVKAFIQDNVGTFDIPSSGAVSPGVATLVGMVRVAGATIAPVLDALLASTPETTNGNLATAFPVAIGRSNDPGAHIDFEFLGAAIFRSALTDLELAEVKTELLA